MKISRGNSDFLKIKNQKKIHAARKMDAGADDKPGYFFTWPSGEVENYKMPSMLEESQSLPQNIFILFPSFETRFSTRILSVHHYVSLPL